jgi:hypothetical protein
LLNMQPLEKQMRAVAHRGILTAAAKKIHIQEGHRRK